ncbi:DUF962 domain-containing protein [Chryseobacterium sp.]|uniref:DUF962 domain-containing protein n=1 Tax=Chryseobacterium sp. TaxID=1871047 RepID=UPI0011C71310|nr:DUF962 domain-containing protein [Chryseobacterium sp.]TXF78944.1 DUF962 domain-containing protein [Chryseobacterium sp.]
MSERITTYAEYYPAYLAEHQKLGTRIAHFIGTLLFLFVIFYVITSGKERFLWYLPIFGYGFGMLSHVLFEKNSPKTFRHPVWNLASDFRLFFELLTGKQKFKASKNPE